MSSDEPFNGEVRPRPGPIGRLRGLFGLVFDAKPSCTEIRRVPCPFGCGGTVVELQLSVHPGARVAHVTPACAAFWEVDGDDMVAKLREASS